MYRYLTAYTTTYKRNTTVYTITRILTTLIIRYILTDPHAELEFYVQ